MTAITVYLFGNKKADGDGAMKPLLGGKGANLVEMSRIGLPVPPGFSFGTNDLTQTCLGMSRDDSGSFLPPYIEQEIVKKNPFATIDEAGPGKLIQMAVELGRRTRPEIKLGICGEHGDDPDSIKFCHRAGLTYLSCSPFRVPVARLASAQAAMEEGCRPISIQNTRQKSTRLLCAHLKSFRH